MSSRDYMTRYFQQLGKVLARLIGLRERREYQLAMQEVDRHLTEMFNLSAEELNKITTDELIKKVNTGFNPETEANRAIAELFYQKVLLFKEMNNPEELDRSIKITLALFYEIDRNSESFSIEIQQRISNLESMDNKSYSTTII